MKLKAQRLDQKTKLLVVKGDSGKRIKTGNIRFNMEGNWKETLVDFLYRLLP